MKDAWTAGPHTMTWGGTYAGLDHYGVTVLELSGGQQMIPEPASIVVWSLLGGLGLVVSWRRRRRAR